MTMDAIMRMFRRAGFVEQPERGTLAHWVRGLTDGEGSETESGRTSSL
jgi:hypothetical protein